MYRQTRKLHFRWGFYAHRILARCHMKVREDGCGTPSATRLRKGLLHIRGGLCLELAANPWLHDFHAVVGLGLAPS